MEFHELYSPVKIINEFVSVPQPLPDAILSGVIIGDNIKRVERNLGTFPAKPASGNGEINLVLQDGESLVDYTLYKTPISKRKYIDRLYSIVVYDNLYTYNLVEGTHFIVNENAGKIEIIAITDSDNNYLIPIGTIKVLSVDSINNKITVSSLFTSRGYLLNADEDYIGVDVDNGDFRDIQSINGNVLQLNSVNDISTGDYIVFRVITGKNVKGIYRVFVSHDKVYKVNPSDIETLFGPIEPSNPIAFALFLAFTSQSQPRALYACPLKNPFNYSEAFNRITQFQQQNEVILYDFAITSLRPIDANALISYITDRNNPDNSIPVRAWVTDDQYIYEPEYRIFNKQKSDLVLDSNDSASDYEAWHYSNNVSTISFHNIYFNGNSLYLNFDLTSALPSGSYALIFSKLNKDTIIFKFELNSDINSGSSIQLIINRENNNLEIYRYSGDTGSQGILATSRYYFVSQLDLDDYNLSNDVKLYQINYISLGSVPTTNYVLLYTPKVKNIVGDNSIFSDILSRVQSINNEHISYVNPFVFTPTGLRLPGFYLCAMKVGQSVGMAKISEPLSAHPLPRNYISYADYSNNIFDKDYSKTLMENGYDMHVVYDNTFQGWWQRTTYTGPELARKYQHGIKALDYTNWRIKRIALRYTRKYSLQPIIVNLMTTELNRLFKILKADSVFGPVLASDSKIEKVIIVRSPSDVPDYVPVSMESGVLIIARIFVFGFWKETVVYNIVST